VDSVICARRISKCIEREHFGRSRGGCQSSRCYGYSDTNNFYFILFSFLLFFLILLFFFFTLFSWKDNEEGA